MKPFSPRWVGKQDLSCRATRAKNNGFATAIAVLLSVEIAAIVLLLGAQVIAEYERMGRDRVDAPPAPMNLKSSPGKARSASAWVAPHMRYQGRTQYQ